MTGASEIRAVQTARALKLLGDVSTVVVDSEGFAAEWAALPNPEFRMERRLAVEAQPNNSILQTLRWWRNARSAYPHGSGVNAEEAAKLVAMTKDFDLVWFCKLRGANQFPQWAWPRSVVDIDDVPSLSAASDLQCARGFKAKLLAQMRHQSWRLRDRLLGERFDVLAVCSDADRKYLRGLGVRKPLHVIPNGFEAPKSEPIRRPAKPPRFGFIGIFDYAPNREGVEWFAHACWPLIKRELPDARLRLIGRHSDSHLKPLGLDIDGLGFLKDPAPEMATWSGMVVPILTGAGTRGKIAHAFSSKCPLVSTTLGAHGYEVRQGELVMLADSAADFARCCVQLARDPAVGEAMSQRAWQAFLKNWTWSAIQPSVCATAEECLRRNSILPART